MSTFVRQSKYRHVFGTNARREECYDQIKVTRSAWDSNKVAASTKSLSVIWEAGGGGAFVPINYSDSGKRTPNPPLVSGHKGEVLDIDYHPFNPYIIASASEDCTVKIWQLPKDGIKENLTKEVQDLRGHKRKVGTCLFNPVANNILATSGSDYIVNVWDIESGKNIHSISGHSNIIQSVNWNSNGSLLLTSSKDKRLRLIDPRTGGVVRESEAHEGVKDSVQSSWMEKIKCSLLDLTNLLIDNTNCSISTTLTTFCQARTSIPLLDKSSQPMMLILECSSLQVRETETSVTTKSPTRENLSTIWMNINLQSLSKVCVLFLNVLSISLDVKSSVSSNSTKLASNQSLSVFHVKWNCSKMISTQIPMLEFLDSLQNNGSMEKMLILLNAVLSLLITNKKKKEVEEQNINFTKVEVKELSEKEVREEYENQKKRIAYLETELLKRDNKIDELNKKLENK